MVDIVQCDDDYTRTDVIEVSDTMVIEVAADKPSTVGDEAVDVIVDECATATRPEVFGSRSCRMPPMLMLRWTLPNVISIPSCRPEKAERVA
jgi:hypothetical protein